MTHHCGLSAVTCALHLSMAGKVILLFIPLFALFAANLGTAQHYVPALNLCCASENMISV